MYEGQHLAERHLGEQVTLISADNESITILMDTQTHLPLERIFQWRDPLYKDKNTDAEEYDDYHTMDGFPTPFSITRYKNDEMCRQYYIKKVTFNQTLPGDFWSVDAADQPHQEVAREAGARLAQEHDRRRSALVYNPQERKASRLPALWSQRMNFDIQEIMGFLPHRYPFLLIDRIVEFEPSKRLVAIKNVTINEPFFQGHFPGYPIMPGVLVVEAMAQAGGIIMMAETARPRQEAGGVYRH